MSDNANKNPQKPPETPHISTKIRYKNQKTTQIKDYIIKVKVIDILFNIIDDCENQITLSLREFRNYLIKYKNRRSNIEKWNIF